jgi:hypothetical protein
LDWGQVDTVIRSHVSMTDVRSWYRVFGRFGYRSKRVTRLHKRWAHPPQNNLGPFCPGLLNDSTI